MNPNVNPAHTPTVFSEKILLAELMAITLDELKAAQDIWQRLSQNEQDEVIERLQKRCADAAKQTVNLILSAGFARLTGTLESVAVKDGIKAVLTFSATDPERHSLTDATGGKVTVVLTDTNGFVTPAHDHKAEAPHVDDLAERALKKIGGKQRRGNDNGNLDKAA